MKIRPFTTADTLAAAAVFRDAVINLAPQAYTDDEVDAWARCADDTAAFARQLSKGKVFVAEEDSAVVAFGQLEPTDHIAFIYCSARFARRGYGTAIYRRLETIAMQQGADALHTAASRVARPFFEKLNYTVVAAERPVRRGVALERFKMRKPLPATRRPASATDARFVEAIAAAGLGLI